MKLILSILILNIFLPGHSQISGGLNVQSYSNTTNNLTDNIKSDSTFVQIINPKYGIDTSICFSEKNRFRIFLKPGNYRLICSLNSSVINLENVIISSDNITFVELLFEPNKELSFFEKRRRKKLYSNFENL